MMRYDGQLFCLVLSVEETMLWDPMHPQLSSSNPLFINELVKLSPCETEYDYSKWNDVRKQNIEQVTCRNNNDRQAIVFVVGVEDIDEYFQRLWKEEMVKRPSSTAHRWALRLGAQGHEAQHFAGLRDEGDIWDYVAALMARSGIVRFQPWIANDIKSRIKSTGIPLNWPYTAISAYRGDGGISRRPRDLLAYFQRLESAGCDNKARPVYVATDDPGWIQDEIDRFFKASECRDVKFILSSINDPLDAADVGTDCSRLHRAKIAAMADLMILARSETYLGGSDYSDVDWLVRIFRTEANSSPDTTHGSSCYG